MIDPKLIRIQDYTYNLPNEKIAKYPHSVRDTSKLLVFKNQSITDSHFHEISKFIPQNSLIVSNNSKVIPARIFFQKKTGATIEIFCLEPLSPTDYTQSFQQTSSCEWKCIVGNLKKWKNETLEKNITIQNQTITLRAELTQKNIGEQHIRFYWNNSIPFSLIIEHAGKIPIPPYLERETEESDLTQYQTIYSKIKGSVAAPTAGLHFTQNVFTTLTKNACTFTELTLHVGAGTFKPVKADQIGMHEMHQEYFEISKQSLEMLKDATNIVSVGTTTTRSLESLYWLANSIQNNQNNDTNVSQWQPYNSASKLCRQQACEILLNHIETQNTDTLKCGTSIMLVPGYSFQFVDQLITNFHQPNSTLILLVAAFVGESWEKIYNHALQHNYRFLSYGDSSLLFKP